MHGCVRDFNRKSKMIHQGSGSGTDISTFNDLAIFTASQFGTKSRCNKHLRQSTTGLDHMSSPKYLNTCKVTGRTRWDSESLCGSKIEHNDDIMALRFQNNAKLWGQRLSNMDILECTESLDYWERNLSHPLPWHAAATNSLGTISSPCSKCIPVGNIRQVHQAYSITTRGVWIFFLNSHGSSEFDNLQPKSPILNMVPRCHLCYLCSTSLQAADMALEATQRLRWDLRLWDIKSSNQITSNYITRIHQSYILSCLPMPDA